MLEALLAMTVTDADTSEVASKEPVLRYLVSESPSLGNYLEIDDSAVWSALRGCTTSANRAISELATRLRDRRLFKCVDIGARDQQSAGLYQRFQLKLQELPCGLRNDLLYDAPTVVPYKWYDYEATSAHNKILVKPSPNMANPIDIADASRIAESLRTAERVQRVYAPNSDQATKILKVV